MKSIIDEHLSLTPALEDYLETIYKFIQKQGFARVKDIAVSRDVKAGSVSPAMKRLADMGLIDYMQREYIKLTEDGEALARKIYARHEILKRFFKSILNMSEEEAEQDACAMEHSLSSKAMERFVRLFEFIEICPHGALIEYWQHFHECCFVNYPENSEKCHECNTSCEHTDEHGHVNIKGVTKLSDAKPGDHYKIIKIDGDLEVRRHLLDHGIIPELEIEIDHFYPNSDKILIVIDDFKLTINRTEAENILISKI